MSDRRRTRETRSTGATFCFLVLTLFGTMGGTPLPANGSADAARFGPYGPVSISAGVDAPRARALPASASFTTAVPESHDGGGAPRPSSASSAARAPAPADLPAARDGLPPGASPFGLRGLPAHPPTAPPHARPNGRA